MSEIWFFRIVQGSTSAERAEKAAFFWRAVSGLRQRSGSLMVSSRDFSSRSFWSRLSFCQEEAKSELRLLRRFSNMVEL